MKYLNDVNHKDCAGKVCKSKLSGDFKVLKYNNNRNVEIQFLNTEIEAFNAYNVAKESFVKEQAEEYKSQIDPGAYEALMKYTVEITD